MNKSKVYAALADLHAEMEGDLESLDLLQKLDERVGAVDWDAPSVVYLEELFHDGQEDIYLDQFTQNQINQLEQIKANLLTIKNEVDLNHQRSLQMVSLFDLLAIHVKRYQRDDAEMRGRLLELGHDISPWPESGPRE